MSSSTSRSSRASGASRACSCPTGTRPTTASRAANNGLDLEMPSPHFMNAQDARCRPSRTARSKKSTIDDKVLRIFRTELALWLGSIARNSIPRYSTYSVADRPTALERRAREHHAAQERRAPAAARCGEDQDHRHHRSRCMARSARRRRLLRGDAVRAGLHCHRHRQPAWAQTSHVLYTRGLPEMNDIFGQHALGGRRESRDLPQQGLHRLCPKPRRSATSPTTSRSGGARKTRHRAAFATPPLQSSKAGKYLLLAAASGERSLQGQRRWQADHRAGAC